MNLCFFISAKNYSVFFFFTIINPFAKLKEHKSRRATEQIQICNYLFKLISEIIGEQTTCNVNKTSFPGFQHQVASGCGS